MWRGVVRRSMVVGALLAAAVAGAEQPADSSGAHVFYPARSASRFSVLVGDTVSFDSAGTEGHPDRYEWRLTPPDGVAPDKPNGTGSTYVFTPSSGGTWTVQLTAHYLHEVSPGVRYSQSVSSLVVAKPVVADVAPLAAEIGLNKEIVVDGTGSVWGTGITPEISWLVSGPTSYYCGTELTCTVPGNSLDPGYYTFTLTLTDPSSGISDSATVETTVVEVPMLDVDFRVNPESPDPGVRAAFAVTFSPENLIPESSLWDFGDGSSPLERCPSFCNLALHTFDRDGWFEVELYFATTDGQNQTVRHLIKVGDPAEPPTASFTASTASVRVPVAFTFTGSCTGTCSYDWAFGDGAYAFVSEPNHAYDRDGTYTVTLTVSNAAGSHSDSQPIDVSNCWTPDPPTQYGNCYGGDVILTAAAGTGYYWSTGAVTRSIVVGEPGAYWVSVASSSACWGTAEIVVVLQNCGDANGDANLDGVVDAADLAALAAEITDDDGESVVRAGAGARTAPGGDTTGDEILNPADIETVLSKLFE